MTEAVDSLKFGQTDDQQVFKIIIKEIEEEKKGVAEDEEKFTQLRKNFMRTKNEFWKEQGENALD